AIANALKEASENNRIQVQETILAHWNAQASFNDAVEKNEANRVEALLKDPPKKAAIGKEAIQDGLKKAANDEPPKPAVVKAILENLTPAELAQALKKAARKGDDKVVAAILDNVKDQLSPSDVGQALKQAVQNGQDKVVEVILGKAFNEITAPVLQEAFKTAASADATAPIVAVLLKKEAAQRKIGNTAIANALKEASSNNRTEVEKAILDHWNINSAFSKAVTNNNEARIEDLLSNAKTKAKVDQQTIQDGLKEAANDPAKTAVMEAILKNLTPAEIAEALQQALTDREDKVVEAILAWLGDDPDKIAAVLEAAKKDNKYPAAAAAILEWLSKIEDNAIRNTFKTAAEKGYTSLVVAILDNAKDKLTNDEIGEAIKVAGEKGHAETVEAILNNNNTPLDKDLALDWLIKVGVLNAAIKKNRVKVIETALNNRKLRDMINSLEKNKQGSIAQHLLIATIAVGKSAKIVAAMFDIQVVKEIVEDPNLNWVVRDAFKAAAGVTERIGGDHDNLGKNDAAVIRAILKHEGAKKQLDRTTLKISLDKATEEDNRKVIKAILDSKILLVKDDIRHAISIASDTETVELLEGYLASWP
ncbi:MAG: hypothetical protein MI674_04845, partial [Cytophagales bacterium]|nr:hypothetical protein [Cytophagales bacterium]